MLDVKSNKVIYIEFTKYKITFTQLFTFLEHIKTICIDKPVMRERLIFVQNRFVRM